jgi:hypothetical protein
MVDSPGTICSTEAGGSTPLCVTGPLFEPLLDEEPEVDPESVVATTDDVTRSVVNDELFGALVVV